MYVAVYGTLRRGEGNWAWALKNTSAFIGDYRIPGFVLFSNGCYPYAVEGSGEITVEIFEIDAETLNRLDHLEGYPHHYNRKKITVGEKEAWIYFTEREEIKCSCTKIPSGDWLDGSEKDFTSSLREGDFANA